MGMYWDNGKENGNYNFWVQGLGLQISVDTVAPPQTTCYHVKYVDWDRPTHHALECRNCRRTCDETHVHPRYVLK